MRVTGSKFEMPIEFARPADVAFGAKDLNQRQQSVLDKLSERGSMSVFKKRDVSMLDLATLTALSIMQLEGIS